MARRSPKIDGGSGLSNPRFARYVHAAGEERALALRLYEWNAQISAAVLHDLAHLEIGLRNAYDRVLTAAALGRGTPWGEWTDPDGPLFAPLYRSRRGQPATDVNERAREDLRARQAAGTAAPHGKIVAELMFGFWRYLSSAAHGKTLWVPHLHKAFPRGTDRRRDVDEPVAALNRLRNRAAHHEHLLGEDLTARHRQLLAFAGLLSPELGQYLDQVSPLPRLLSQRPT
jgi:hypothetical protein